MSEYSHVLQEALFQKAELTEMADRLYGIDTPERAAFEARLSELGSLDMGQLVELLKMVASLRSENG